MLDITFNRQEKQYEWTDPDSGEVLTAPAGAANKAALFRTAIGLLDPELDTAAQRIIERHPQLERVTWKAVELVAAGAVDVFDAPRAGVWAMVDSQSDGYGRYAITNDGGYFACQCQHFVGMTAPITEEGNRYCKHIVAMHLWKVTKENRF